MWTVEQHLTRLAEVSRSWWLIDSLDITTLQFYHISMLGWTVTHCHGKSWKLLIILYFLSQTFSLSLVQLLRVNIRSNWLIDLIEIGSNLKCQDFLGSWKTIYSTFYFVQRFLKHSIQFVLNIIKVSIPKYPEIWSVNKTCTVCTLVIHVLFTSPHMTVLGWVVLVNLMSKPPNTDKNCQESGWDGEIGSIMYNHSN